MHDLILAFAFVGMVLAPAIVSATGTVQPREEQPENCSSCNS